jgi:hypothetical protein
MNLKQKKYFATIILSSLFFIANNAHAITLSPVRIEVSGDPGSVLRPNVKILNEEDVDITLYKSAEGFEGEGETGTPKLNGLTEGLPSWISTEGQVEIMAGQVSEIPVAIAIPSGTEPGGYYGALCWNSNPPGLTDPGVAIGSKICSIVLVNVNGPVKEGGGILDYFLTKQKKYYNALPVSFTYRFQNSGNALVKPEGEIVIKNIFGIKAKTLNANNVEGNVLPRGGIRKYEVVWSKDASDFKEIEGIKGFFNIAKYQWDNFALGRFTAQLDLSFGTKDKATESKKLSFWVIPWQLLLLAIVVLILIFNIFKKIFRSYNNWIIEQAEIAIKKEMTIKRKKSSKELDLS